MMVISTYRFLTFFMLGPAVAVVAAAACIPGALALPAIASILLLFVWPLFAVAGAFDQYLARALPVPLRAILMALLGAAIAVGFVHVTARVTSMKWWLVPPSIFVPFAVIGAVVMGLCALLSEDFRKQDNAG
jgi:hypothetical protein